MNHLAVHIQNLTKTYHQGFRREKMKAVDQLSLTIEKGTVMGLVGPNGAGKTTTIYCMLGLLVPDEGSISIFGNNPQSKESHRQIGFQSEIFHTHEFLKPRKVLQFYGTLSGMSKAELRNEIDFQISRFGLDHSRDQKIGSFSKGMKQRLGIAQALLHDPDLLILDEPFTGLDPEGRRLIADIIHEEKGKGKTVFFSSHILSDIERLCDKVTMIRKGEVVLSGGMKDITTSKSGWLVKVTGWQESYEATIQELITDLENTADSTRLYCTTENKHELLQKLLDLPVSIIRIRPETQSLEELYMKIDEEEKSHA